MSDALSATPARRSRSRRSSHWLARAIFVWALLMAPLLWWGLPSTRQDRLLFGGASPWPAERYHVEADLEQLSARNAGADTDLNPLDQRDRVIDLTSNDAARAEILRRYRLFSHQPDEMIIFRALQRMHPRRLDFDPRLYQYGGGYIYLVGAAVGASSALGITHLTSDPAYYLQEPDAFGRFYVVARFISLAFGALTLVAVHKLARRAGGHTAAWIATVCTAAAPVFITAVLEAKPHLPSACLVLWTILFALNYHFHGRRGAAVRMGLVAGGAFGLVLTGALAALLWPAVLCTASPGARVRTLRHLLLAGGLALLIYVITNPYIPYNYFCNRAALTSNISNSTAMYREQIIRALDGAVHVVGLLVEGAGVGVVFMGLVGLARLLRRRTAPTSIAAATGIGMLGLCILLGAGKPAEFARFLILPILLLIVAGAWMLSRLVQRHVLLGVVGSLAVLAATPTTAYIRSFYVDARAEHVSRFEAGCYLAEHAAPNDAIGVFQEPAPYAVPPLDFAQRRIQLLPTCTPRDFDRAALPAWLVFTADDDAAQPGTWWREEYQLAVRFPPPGSSLSPIAWANKPVFVYRRAP